MQTYIVNLKSFKSVIRLYPLEKIPKINKRMGTFIPNSRVVIYVEIRLHKELQPIILEYGWHASAQFD